MGSAKSPVRATLWTTLLVVWLGIAALGLAITSLTGFLLMPAFVAVAVVVYRTGRLRSDVHTVQENVDRILVELFREGGRSHEAAPPGARSVAGGGVAGGSRGA